MRYVYQSVTGTAGGPFADGTSAPVPLDVLLNPFSVGVGCSVQGTVNYTVQHTFADIWTGAFTEQTANWWPHVSLVAQTGIADGNYAFPCRAVRVKVNSGTGTVTMAVGQAGLV